MPRDEFSWNQKCSEIVGGRELWKLTTLPPMSYTVPSYIPTGHGEYRPTPLLVVHRMYVYNWLTIVSKFCNGLLWRSARSITYQKLDNVGTWQSQKWHENMTVTTAAVKLKKNCQVCERDVAIKSSLTSEMGKVRSYGPAFNFFAASLGGAITECWIWKCGKIWTFSSYRRRDKAIEVNYGMKESIMNSRLHVSLALTKIWSNRRFLAPQG